ncbi:sulfatase-like hydrolase/transferase [Sphingobacterium spiritivorum]|uniref:sulfatase-like hydrolase/transferase n=1 Tax=Sphingobacterium spiritivorum TaxID=258 RepID=UPI003DA6AE92
MGTLNQIVFLFTLFMLTTGSVSAQQRPNIILILSDDGGYEDFGCYGSQDIPTPHIDALAKGGIRFTNSYVTASVCAPSRAGLLMGQYQQRSGFEHNVSDLPADGYQIQDIGLSDTVRTIADQMQSNGYETMAIGKWHQGNETKHHPLHKGFNHFFGFIGGHRSFFPIRTAIKQEEKILNDYTEVDEKDVYYLTDMFTDKAISYMRQERDKPYFIYLSYNAVHTPVEATPQKLAQFAHLKDAQRRSYAGLMSAMDDGIGRIVEELKKTGQLENTLLIFLNDNGAATNNGADNGPLRGLKGSKWEGGIRVPMIMHWPKQLLAGKDYKGLVSSLDLVPTCVAAAQGTVRSDMQLDGVNILPFLTGKNKLEPHNFLCWRRGVAAAIRKEQWKLIQVRGESPLLFDLNRDKGETRNLAETHPQKVKELTALLQHWEQGLDNPHWTSSYGDYNQIMKHKMDVIGRKMERQYP